MTQTWDPARYARHGRFVADLAGPVVEMLAPRAGERILDLGCGDGALTERLVALGCDVVGVDASAEQVEAARKRGLDARVADAAALPFDGEFDAVFTNAVLHWIHRPDDVIADVWRALRPGGRFVGEFGGHGCVATIASALRDTLAAMGVDASRIRPWYYPTDAEYRDRLAARGFRVRTAVLVPRPTVLPSDITDWLELFAETFLAAAPAGRRAELLADVRERVRPALRQPDGSWIADYVRLRFAADKP